MTLNGADHRAQRDDREGFEEFYRAAYARLVGQLLSVTGDLEQAEDVVQEAFVRALNRWSRISTYDVPEAWVRRVAVNLALSEFRRLRRRAAALLRLGARGNESHLPPDTIAMVEFLRQVPANQRAVLLLHDVVDLPIGQVAEQLGLSVSTARGRLARARATLSRHAAADTEGGLNHRARH